ncbi:MAG TPA: hypothetical protein VMX17_01585 [Candidatus Glassbacteria bacterium]|nr:hypothetical protein [Candidatus Glassbacteria bacterium]
MDKSRQALSDIIVWTKYAKYLELKQRRELFHETVSRNEAMHVKKFPLLKEEIQNAFKFVYDKKILPSMRSLQFGGKPVEISPNRQYNCGYCAIDDWLAFPEIMFLLLGGTGLGYSVQKQHIKKLPPILGPNKKRTKRFLIADSIEGWADAVKNLLDAYINSKSVPLFDYSDIRAKGAPLKTSGGRSPGPQPLKDCIHNLKKILDNKEPGEKLTSLECHDMICYIADAVLAGGIRRAALIAFFYV